MTRRHKVLKFIAMRTVNDGGSATVAFPPSSLAVCICRFSLGLWFIFYEICKYTKADKMILKLSNVYRRLSTVDCRLSSDDISWRCTCSGLYLYLHRRDTNVSIASHAAVVQVLTHALRQRAMTSLYTHDLWRMPP